jgi:hypothetical protein
MPQKFWWGTVPKWLGGEALLTPGRFGGEPYPLGAGRKILVGAHGPHIEAWRVRPREERYLSLNIRVMRIGLCVFYSKHRE